MTTPRLGRGFASLIPAEELEPKELPAKREAWKIVPIEEIKLNPEQPRKNFDEAALQELSTSIRAHGVLSPLIVRVSDGRYILIAGERRWRAAARAGLKEVPVVVVKDADSPGRQLELALVENLLRADLDPLEEARGFHRLVEEHGYTQDQVAAAVGKDRTTISNAIRLLRLPEFVLDALQAGRISAGHARAMLPLADENQQRLVLAKIEARGLSVRQTESLVKGLDLSTDLPNEPTEPSKKISAFEYAETVLREALHTSVAIKAGARGTGQIIIKYSNAEDLERLISLLQREET
jgi:ParB family chromosome partitioning protein